MDKYLNNNYFNIGRPGSPNVRNVNIALLAIACLFVFALLFYITIYSTTNYHALDDLDDYVQLYDADENAQFENVYLGLKIMPSYNTEKNVLYMDHSNDFYKSKIPNSISLMETFNMKNTFFFVNKTRMFFPKFRFSHDNIPVGDSITMCIAISWSPKERGRNYDVMKPVNGFPRCSQTETGKFIWNSEDPVFGVDIPVWKQHSFEVECYEEDCDRYCESTFQAEFLNGRDSKRCYKYDILDGICIIIEYDPITEEFTYGGGCFSEGKPYIMTPAGLNETYLFEGVEIEVRNKKDPIIKAAEMSNYTFSFGAGWYYFAIFLNVLLVFALIGLGVVGYLIYYYRKKYNTGSLLQGEKGPGMGRAPAKEITETNAEINKI